MVEEWRSITGSEGMYEVSDQGRVRSVDRVITARNGVEKQMRGRVLRPWAGSSGYLQVYLQYRDVRMVHHLVLQEFIGPRGAELEGRHLNGNPVDNRAVNLEWATHLENVRDIQKHGNDWQRNKTHCPRGHELQEPNLVPSRWREGYRLCRACNREYFRARHQNREFDASLADQDYTLIQEGKVRVRGGVRTENG